MNMKFLRFRAARSIAFAIAFIIAALPFAHAEGITEDLKARDQLAWVGRMNSIRQQAEEMILQELIYE